VAGLVNGVRGMVVLDVPFQVYFPDICVIAHEKLLVVLIELDLYTRHCMMGHDFCSRKAVLPFSDFLRVRQSAWFPSRAVALVGGCHVVARTEFARDSHALTGLLSLAGP
jgi:hypothetical protein